jgi:hypothetical protein
MKKATTLGNGFIQFYLSGKDGVGGPGAIRPENTVMFRAAHQAEFEKIKAAIEAKMAAPRVALSQFRPRAISYIDELEQLASLRDRGIITDDEFAAKKRQILGI